MKIKKLLLMTIVVSNLIITSSCKNYDINGKSMWKFQDYIFKNGYDNKFSKIIPATIGLGSIAYLAYDYYNCKRNSNFILNQNTLINIKNIERLKEYPFLIDKIFTDAKTKPIKNIITLQEIPNYKDVLDYLKSKAEENGYYCFYEPYGPRLKPNTKEKMTLLVVMLNKKRFNECKKSVWVNKSNDECNNILGVSARDKKNKEYLLILSVHANLTIKSRKAICTRFYEVIQYFKNEFDKEFTKIIAPGDYNAFADEEECTKDYYVGNFKKSFQKNKFTPHYYNPYEKAVHEQNQAECSHSFFPEWSDILIATHTMKSLEKLKKMDIIITPTDLSHFGKLNSKYINLNIRGGRDFSLKGKIKYTKQKTNLSKLINDIKNSQNFKDDLKKLIINILTKIGNYNINDIELDDKEYHTFIVLNAIQQMNNWHKLPNKLDMVNIGSKEKLVVKTIIPNQLLNIADLLNCHDEETKKQLSEKIIFRNKLFQYMPRPNIPGLWDNDQTVETKTVISDHLSNITSIKKMSYIEQFVNLFYR